MSRLDVLTGCAIIAAATSVVRLVVAVLAYRRETHAWGDLQSALSEPSKNESIVSEHFGNGHIRAIRSSDQ
jgi:hypothetical protein